VVAIQPWAVPMNELRIVVLGEPKPQGSTRAFVAKGRAYVASNHKQDFVVWRNSIVEKAERVWTQDPATCAMVELVFRMPVPKSRPKYLSHWAPHTKRPDIDKLARAVLDALVAAGVLSDDSVVTSLMARKEYALSENPGVAIIVTPIKEPKSPRAKE
jgi:crossover junction endodeoxyribonuclease RusA